MSSRSATTKILWKGDDVKTPYINKPTLPVRDAALTSGDSNPGATGGGAVVGERRPLKPVA